MSCSRNSKRASALRCSMLVREPVERLSTPSTKYPSANRASVRWEPTKPAAPLTSTRIDYLPASDAKSMGCHPSTVRLHLINPQNQLSKFLRLLLERSYPAPAAAYRDNAIAAGRVFQRTSNAGYIGQERKDNASTIPDTGGLPIREFLPGHRSETRWPLRCSESQEGNPGCV